MLFATSPGIWTTVQLVIGYRLTCRIRGMICLKCSFHCIRAAKLTMWNFFLSRHKTSYHNHDRWRHRAVLVRRVAPSSGLCTISGDSRLFRETRHGLRVRVCVRVCVRAYVRAGVRACVRAYGVWETNNSVDGSFLASRRTTFVPMPSSSLQGLHHVSFLRHSSRCPKLVAPPPASAAA